MQGLSRALVVFICIWSLCVQFAFPQTAQNSNSDMLTDNSSLSYAMEVELAQISVRIVDKGGKFVSGLKDKDIELFEDGTKQEIRYVDEITATTEKPKPSPGPRTTPAERKEFTVTSVLPNSVIILFDTTSSGQIGVETHKKYIKDFLQSYDVPNTIFSLIIIKPTGDYEVSRNFTDDKTVLVEALDDVKGSTAGIQEKIFKTGQLSDVTIMDQCTAARGQVSTDTCFENALGGLVRKADSFAQEEQNRASNALNSMKEIFALAQHVPGRKGVLLISEGLDPTGSFYYNYGANVIKYWMEHYGVPQQYAYYINDMKAEASRSLSKINAVRDLIKSANAAGLNVYWANPTYGQSATDSASEFSTTSGLDFKLVNAPDVDSTMRGIAEDTGGLALASNNPADFYKKLKDTIPQYYLINYKPSRAINDGKFHRVEVKAKNTDYKVIYAKDFKDTELIDRIKNQLAGAIDFPTVTSDFPAGLSIGYFKKSTGEYQLIVRSAVSYKDLNPQVVENRYVDDIHFVFMVRDTKGDVVENTHPILKIRTPLEEFQTLQDKGASLEFAQNYSLKPGAYQISLAVMDVTGWRTGTNTDYIKLPAQTEPCLSMSPPLLASSATKAATPAKDPMPTEKGEIAYGDNVFHFSVARYFPTDGALAGFYQIYNAKPTQQTTAPSVSVSFALYRDKTVFVNKTSPRQVTSYNDPIQKVITNFFSVPYHNLAPGSYELEITARDSNTDCSSSSRVAFNIVAPAGQAQAPASP